MRLYLQSCQLQTDWFHGGLAQLARALAWHARGRRFDPDTLHQGSHYCGPFLFHILHVLAVMFFRFASKQGSM